jgi:hypothetical protein
MRTDMLNLTRPRRSPILLSYVLLLDGGTVLRRFVALRGKVASRRAEEYRHRLMSTPP